MPRAEASIQAEIAALEAKLQAVEDHAVSADGASLTRNDRAALERRLDQLYSILDRRSVGGFVRGRVVGLGGG